MLVTRKPLSGIVNVKTLSSAVVCTDAVALTSAGEPLALLNTRTTLTLWQATNVGRLTPATGMGRGGKLPQHTCTVVCCNY